jgi:hypothetical protein
MIVTSFREWLALRETSDDPIPKGPRQVVPRRRWQPEEVKPKTFAQQFVDGFRAKHADLWAVLDGWMEQQGGTVDDLAERLLKERPGDVRGVYYEMLKLAQQVGGGIG